jgi:predicted NBD/HSP70 family sugar kinase
MFRTGGEAVARTAVSRLTQFRALGGDQIALRRHNLSTVLRQLRDHGPRSRAGIALDTGLNKATVSSLVSELIDRGLVREGQLARGAVGRPGQDLELDGTTVVGIGLEINGGYLAAQAVDLGGDIRYRCHVSCDVQHLRPDQALDVVAPLIRSSVETVQAMGVTPLGVAIAVPELVDSEPGLVSAAPQVPWHNVRVATMLAERLERPAYPILIKNEAHLAALAEYVAGSAAGSPNLLLLSADGGVSAGIVADGRLFEGAGGYAGHLGHVPLNPEGPACSCGRRGCWETLVGLSSLLHAATDPDDPVRNPNKDLMDRLAELTRRAANADARTLSAFEEVGRWLGVGTAILINLLNPEVVVLGGYFAALGTHLTGPMTRQLTSLAATSGGGGCRVELSTLGLTAAARGGAQLVLESVIDDPTIVPVRHSSIAIGDSA